MNIADKEQLKLPHEIDNIFFWVSFPVFFAAPSVDPPGALYKAALCGAEEIHRGRFGVKV